MCELFIAVGMSKRKHNVGGIVYSTDPGFVMPGENYSLETLPSAQQKLEVLLDRKQRAGKSVTLVTGFIGTESDLSELGKKLKTFCGTGGSVKDGQIIIQGDNREKVTGWLSKNGYSASV